MLKNKNRKVYKKEDLERQYFYDGPSTGAQNYMGTFSNEESLFPSKNYIYNGKLSNGSASKLYKASKITGDPDSEENLVVIKKIPKHEEWRTELDILQKIKGRSPRLLNIIDFFESDRNAYIVCNYFPGFDLFEHVHLNVPYPMLEGKKLIKNMMFCIKDCHDAGIAHLDIKCENFMYNDSIDFPLTLIDFGHAEIIERNVMKELPGSYGTCFYLLKDLIIIILQDLIFGL